MLSRAGKSDSDRILVRNSMGKTSLVHPPFDSSVNACCMSNVVAWYELIIEKVHTKLIQNWCDALITDNCCTLARSYFSTADSKITYFKCEWAEKSKNGSNHGTRFKTVRLHSSRFAVMPWNFSETLQRHKGTWLMSNAEIEWSEQWKHFTSIHRSTCSEHCWLRWWIRKYILSAIDYRNGTVLNKASIGRHWLQPASMFRQLLRLSSFYDPAVMSLVLRVPSWHLRGKHRKQYSIWARIAFICQPIHT